jgi:DNA repair exonuclease SbcCD ATPase subunit
MPPPVDKESQKKMIGELLKSADRYIKSAQWTKALEEVDKALAIEQNNMYSMAYRDRINISLAEERKKAENEKVKKLSEDLNTKTVDKTVEEPKLEIKINPAIVQPSTEEKKTEPAKPEVPKAELKVEIKAPATPEVKDESAARLESLRQEFSATQAKLQREVAQLSMQLKELQAMKDASEKNLNAQIISAHQEIASAKQTAKKSTDKDVDALKKEIETLKSKHQKEIDSTKEIAKAEMLAQAAILQKEAEAAKKSAGDTSIEKQGESIIQMMFHIAWKDGAISPDERALLTILKDAIKMSDQKFNELEISTKSEAYANALRTVWLDGSITPDESDFLASLREKLGIKAEEHFKMESQIRRETKK